MTDRRATVMPVATYALGALVLSLPWLTYGYLFSADEYIHVYNACILDDLLLGGDELGFAEWFALNPWPEPNLLGHALLVGLAQVVPLYVAEKFFIVALAAGVGYAFLRACDPLQLGDASAARSLPAGLWRAGLGVLALTFVFGAVLRYGFVNYLLGMTGLLVALVATGRRVSGPRWAIAGWALVLYFCHPIALLLFTGTVALRELLYCGLLSPTLRPRRGPWGRMIGDLARWFGLPLALFVAYVLRQDGGVSSGGGSLRRLGGFVLYFRDLALYDSAEQVVAIGVLGAAVVACLFGATWLALVRGPRLAVAAAGLTVLVVVVVVVPDVLAGGAYIYQRLRPFAFVWALWASAHAYGLLPEAHTLGFGWGIGALARFGLRPRLAVVTAGLAVAAAGGLTTLRLPAVAALAAEFDELRAFGRTLPTGSVVLPASPSVLVNGQEDFSSPLHHFAGVLGCERGLVLLDNYEASVGYFPLLWAAGRDPFANMTRGTEAHPVTIPLSGRGYFVEHVDFVLSRGSLEESVASSTVDWMGPLLRPVGRSQSGRYRLYEVSGR